MNWLALLWVMLSLSGVAISLFALRDINHDREALDTTTGPTRRNGDGAMRVLILTRFRREVVRLVGCSALAMAGVFSFLPGTSDVERVVIYVGLYGGTAALITNSLLEQLDRATMRRLFP